MSSCLFQKLESFAGSYGSSLCDGVSLSIQVPLGALVLLLVLRHRQTLYFSLLCLPRDLTLLYQFIWGHVNLLYCQVRNLSLPDLLDLLVKKDPNRVLICFEDEEWTARKVQLLSLKVANYFLKRGVKKGDVIGLFMDNSPEYIPITMGLSRIGCVTALINTSLRSKPLSHSIACVGCKALIYSANLSSAVEELRESGELESSVGLYHCGGLEVSTNELWLGSVDLLEELRGVVGRGVRNVGGFKDPLVYIFTSGTTGVPKAAVIKNSRILSTACALYHFGGLRRSDRIYTALPTYHYSGFAVTGGLTAVFGVPVIIRRKFSAANYWKDCVKYKATVGHYIGELCRYVLVQPESSLDRSHTVRLMMGNGVRPDVWAAFQRRFGVNFCEFYGSTEGNANLVNLWGKVGAVGFLPNFLQPILPLKIIRLDKESGAAVRDEATGRAEVCGEDEVGELIAKIYRNHPFKDFEGYADKAVSEAKILRNVFKKGDAWFRSGDLFSQDKFGYFYFKDRLGDTFRWKGENVSTTEVESVLSGLVGMQDVLVFGVGVPGAEGKAGMAVICDLLQILSLPKFVEAMDKVLPKYAQPLFLRISHSADITGTFKLKKTEYQKIGYNFRETEDKIFFLRRGQYVPLDQNLYEDILQENLRL